MVAIQIAVTGKTIRKWIHEFHLNESHGVFRVPGSGKFGSYRILWEIFEREFIQKAPWRKPVAEE